MIKTSGRVRIPNEWAPRRHQRLLYDQFGYGRAYQRAAVVWHRRAGKDSTALNLTAREMFKRPGNYWHLFPIQKQGRKAVWNGKDGRGRRVLDQFLPPEVRTRTDSQEMFIEVAGTGSTWQLGGSDNYDSLVGSNPVGVVFSEWSIADPEAWEFIRPILVENGGWALFIYTPRGRNHGYTLFNTALRSDKWLAQRLSVDDTGVVDKALIEDEREGGMSESKIEQEFFCSFEADVEEQFIKAATVMAARKRESVSWPHDELVMGVDVARYGEDDSVIVLRRGRDARCAPIIRLRGQDNMQVAARVAVEIANHRPDAVFVDEGGVGAGVVDRLIQLGNDIIPVNFGGASDGRAKTKTRNKRAEMWALMREWLEHGAIPDDERLAAELLGPLYKFDENNAIQLEAKEKMRARGVGSPDIADALALTFAAPVMPRSEEDRLAEEEEYDPMER